jgi:hypothetical protein
MKNLVFCGTKDAGSTTNSKPYQMKYTDDWGNVHIHNVDWPYMISNVFESSIMQSTTKIINNCLPEKDYKMKMIGPGSILAYQLIKNVDFLLLYFSLLPQEWRSLSDGAALEVISICNELLESTSTLTGELVFAGIDSY